MINTSTNKCNASIIRRRGKRICHIGAIKNSRGFMINSIAGTSMGALIGGVFATGKLNEFKEWATI
jgi:NTE family protein